MTRIFPKLLIATEFPPNASGGGPAVVRQMLRNWPSEKLCWWSCLPERDSRFGQKVSAHRVAAIPRRLYPNQRWSRQKSWLMEKIWVPRAERHFQKTLETVRPDLVWSIPHLWAIPAVARTLLKAGVGFHITIQDYADLKTYVDRFGADRCQRWVQLVEQLYARAATRDATSHPMIADLRARTGCPAAQMMHAGLEPEDFGQSGKRDSRARVPIKIAYAGTIHTPREFAFFIAALQQLRPVLGVEISLHFFGFHSYAGSPWFDGSWMYEHGDLPERELLAQLRQCDWGFSPMSLQDGDVRYNRFSFPTKFISYLAASLPVITIGHPQNSVVKMATDYRVGLCSVTTETGVLVEQLRKLFLIPDPWQEFGAEVLRCARTEFDAAAKRDMLYQCFRDCAQQTVAKSASQQPASSEITPARSDPRQLI